MTALQQLKSIKVESALPENSRDVVTNVDAKITNILVKEMKGEVKLFINLVTENEKNFVDVITFKPDNMEATLRYLSLHASHILSQTSDYDSFTETFDEIVDLLQNVKKDGLKFKMSTVRSDYNPEYVNVLYGDEEPQTA